MAHELVIQTLRAQLNFLDNLIGPSEEDIERAEENVAKLRQRRELTQVEREQIIAAIELLESV
jgi:hypothetical protein